MIDTKSYNGVYLDNSATTSLCREAWEAMTEAANLPGNPSSLHAAGTAARVCVENARTSVLAASGRADGSWHAVFTGSGSEANNLALLCAAHAKTHFTSRRIITTDSEHPSVARCAERLKDEGFEIIRIPTRKGVLDMGALEAALRGGAFLVSLMLVNNETGAVYDVESAAAMTRAACPDALFHCDAVQGFLRIPLPHTSSGVDMITVSAHKIHGPKGVGALLFRSDLARRRALSPVIYGGGQEEGLCSGTENVIGIAGFGAAATAGVRGFADNEARLRELSDYALTRLGKLEITMNLPQNRASHILSLTLPDIKSQTMLTYLSGEGIYVSSGSACSSHDRHISRTLLAYGLSERAADCTLRVSLSADNTRGDIDRLSDALGDGITRLVRIRR